MTTASRPLATALWGARFAGDWLPSCYTTWGDTTETSNELVFEAHHRDMFRELLDRTELRKTADGGKRDLMSLRHTYISYRVIDGISPWDISLNCRTSVEMIQKHYASRLTALVSNACRVALRTDP